MDCGERRIEAPALGETNMQPLVRRAAIAAWVAGAILFPFACFAQDAQNCQLKRIAALDMTVEHDGRIAVPIAILDRAFLLTVDTGAVYSILSESVASTLQETPRRASMRAGFLGDVTLNSYVTVDGLRIGQVDARRFDFMIAPDRLLATYDGLLGADIMSQYDVEFDFAHAKFNLMSQDHCPGAVVYWTKSDAGVVPMHLDPNKHVKVEVTLDGKLLNAGIDTGAYKSTMSLAVAKNLFGIDENSPGMKRRDGVSINGGRPEPIYHYPFASLSFGEVSVQHPDIDIIAEPANISNDVPLIIGINVLRQLHVYIAYKEQALYVTPAEAQ
jgi:predicted aspartyl protease